jgi:pyruvate/2-oxoglutarate dehydrogenase complex dihydrolipoamide acyltransferase (E2) component
MQVPVKLPKLAETTDVIVVEEWLVAEGDTVTEGQALATMETDKATVDMVSPAAGTVVTLLVAAGEEATTGDDLCILEQ